MSLNERAGRRSTPAATEVVDDVDHGLTALQHGCACLGGNVDAGGDRRHAERRLGPPVRRRTGAVHDDTVDERMHRRGNVGTGVAPTVLQMGMQVHRRRLAAHDARPCTTTRSGAPGTTAIRCTSARAMREVPSGSTNRWTSNSSSTKVCTRVLAAETAVAAADLDHITGTEVTVHDVDQ